MRMHRTLAAIWIGLALAAPGLWAATQTLTLVKGKNQDISPGYSIGRTAIGDPNICDFVIPEGRNSVVLVPKSAGSTNLILYDTDGNKRDTYQLNVVPDLNRLAQELAEVFNNIAGIEVAIRQNRIVVSGSIYSDKDYQLVQDTLRPLGDSVVSDIRLDPEALKLLAEEIERAIGRSEIHTRIVRDKILLEGFAYSKSQVERAEAIAKSLASDRVVDVIELKEGGRFFRQDKLVHFDIKFVEIKYQNMKDWGLDWGDSIATKSTLEYKRGTDQAGNYQLDAVLEDFLPNLNILVQEGAAKLLLNPRLICKNGETARAVVDGGEVPVIVVNQNNISVNYKEFGIIVEVAPLVDAEDNVDATIKVSVLFPAERIQISGVVAPSFDKDEVATNVVLKKNQTLILSGAISNRLRRGFSGWPFLGKIPLIQHFFGTRQLSLNKSEIVVFVTPTVLLPGQGSADVDTKLQQKLQFDIGVEPRFSTDSGAATAKSE
jgi:pilus assembly protein CpaC